MLGRLNARSRFRAIAEASIPLRSICFSETSVNRELQVSKNLIYIYIALLTMLNFFVIIDLRANAVVYRWTKLQPHSGDDLQK